MLSYRFEVGALYSRKRDIHDVFGGQERSGIVTPASLPVIFAFTGVAGLAHGYHDHWDADTELFHYYGEGQVGDMRFHRGNSAIRDHMAHGRKLLVFQQLGKGGPVRYRGEYQYFGHYEKGGVPDTEGNPRTAIVFKLRPLDDEPEDADELIVAVQADGVGDSEAARLMKIRTKQVVFKRNVITVEKGCRLTGIADLRFLRASHMKPWAACELTGDRISAFNGLLLCPQADLLFDRGWISFRDSGQLLVSEHIPHQVVEKIGLNLRSGRRCGQFMPEQIEFLRYHRDTEFEKFLK